MNNHTFIIERIKKIRMSAGYSQQRMSELTKMTRTSYCNIENQNTIPSIETLQNICNALGYEIFIRKQSK